jgi:large subunit ribosomal protein L32e
MPKKGSPKVEAQLRQLVEERRKVAEHRPKFVRQESWRYKRLHPMWRNPKGVDNKVRKSVKGWPAIVKVGYRGPARGRGLHPSGHYEVLIHTVGELEVLVPGRQVARIGSGVGARKRGLLVRRANELGLRILNPRGLRQIEPKK